LVQLFFSPGVLVKRPGESHKLTCTYAGISDGDAAIGWIRQAEGKGLEWLAYISAPSGSTKRYSSSVQNRFTISRDNNVDQVYLQMNSLKTEDSAALQKLKILPRIFVLFLTAETVTVGILATGFTPASLTITWSLGNQPLTDSVQYPAVQKYSYYTGFSQVRLKRSDWEQMNLGYTVDHVTGSITSIKEPPRPDVCEPCLDIKIKPISLEDMFLNKKAELICEVTPKERVSVEWQDKNGQVIVASRNLSESNGKSKFAIIDVLYEEWSKGIDYKCVVEHPDLFEPKREPYRKSGEVPKRPSVFLLPPVEQTRNNVVTLTCYVRDFKPKEIVVSWLVDDVAADSKMYAFNTTNLVENNGVYSVYGQLSFSLDQWKNNEAVYSCVVYHESLMDTSRVIMRSTVTRTAEKSNTVNLNIDLPQTCKA
uniref:Ig-like domain-containing protein n=1 Tax=Myripristis murdjan TaxID=586833 RepID=A0A667Y3Q9_9TELE